VEDAVDYLDDDNPEVLGGADGECLVEGAWSVTVVVIHGPKGRGPSPKCLQDSGRLGSTGGDSRAFKACPKAT